MISLKSILSEIYQTQPIAIVMTGAGGIGKSTFLNTIEPHLPSNVTVFNPDTFNPDDDPKKPNIAKNTKIIRTEAIPKAIENKESFVYDTTGQNLEQTAKVVQDAQQAGYKVMIITLYGSPIVNFLRNFSRERKLPRSVILDNWAKVYRNIEAFSKLPNVEYLLVQTDLEPEEEKAVEEFESALNANELDDYFKQLIGQDPERFRSSFRKPTTDSAEDLPDPEELKKQEEKKKKAEEKWKNAIDNIRDQFKEVEKYLKVLKPSTPEQAVGVVKNFAKP